MSAFSWAHVEGVGKVLVCAVRGCDGAVQLRMLESELSALAGDFAVLPGELVLADGSRLACVADPRGRVALAIAAAGLVSARFEARLPDPV